VVEGIELHNVSKPGGLMLYALQKAIFYLSLKAKKDKTSLESVTSARYTLI
jgi:hypothetical protein